MIQLSIQSPSDTMPGDLPFHGQNEGLVRLWQVLIAVVSALVLLIPWLLKPHSGVGIQHSQTRWLMNAITSNVLSLMVLISYALLDRRLNRRIAIGSVDARFIDSVRVPVVVIINGLLMEPSSCLWSAIFTAGVDS